MNTLELNSAFWNLLNQVEIEESASAIIEYASTISLSGNFSYKSRIDTDQDSPLSGETEHGTIQIEEKKSETIEKEIGIRKTRIGHFKVWKQQQIEGLLFQNKFEEIWFQHFWKAEEISQSQEELLFRIKYNPTTKHMVQFGISEEITIFSFFSLKLLKCRIKSI